MTEKKEVSRATVWKKNVDYVFGLIGMLVGLGNIWRFPYLCYKNGGGAFLVAYFASVLILLFPIIVLEGAVGQLAGRSPVNAWKIVPLFAGIGYAVPLFVIYANSFYAVLLAWGLRWFSYSFSSEQPWMNCDNTWNSNSCYPLAINETISFNKTTENKTGSRLGQDGGRSSVEEFWRDNILGITSGIEDLGGLKPDLAICLVIIWIMAYFALWKGISWTSKIVYVTSTTPFALLIVVLVRGVTLQGAEIGIHQYLTPNIAKLADFHVWADAASQVLYSFGACHGCVTALSGYNKYQHNFLRDLIILVFANAMASFIAGFGIFSVLGYLAQVQGTTLDEVADSGPGLVFVIYPAALSLLPLPQFWLALFFLNILFVGFDSMFVYVEALIGCMRELFPKMLRKKKWSNETHVALWATAICLFGLTMVTRGGIYVLNIFNVYSISGWCLYFFALIEAVTIGWVYGADKMCDDIEDMVGYKIPRLYFKISWKYIVPVISTTLFMYSLIQYRSLTYDDYVYPIWADVIGWMIALSVMLCIPIAAGWALWNAKGSTFAEKYRISTQPAKESGRPVKTKLEVMLLDEKEDIETTTVQPYSQGRF